MLNKSGLSRQITLPEGHLRWFRLSGNIQQQVLRKITQDGTAEGDFHYLAGAMGNDALLRCHSETAAERRVRKGEAKRGIDQSHVGKLQLYNQAESHEIITILHRLYRGAAKHTAYCAKCYKKKQRKQTKNTFCNGQANCTIQQN